MILHVANNVKIPLQNTRTQFLVHRMISKCTYMEHNQRHVETLHNGVIDINEGWYVNTNTIPNIAGKTQFV